MKLKTLKDIEYDKNRLFTDAVKKEAIKWVKEDIRDFTLPRKGSILDRWMKRLNITEENLK